MVPFSRERLIPFSFQDKCPGIAASVGFFDILQFQIHTGSFLIKSVSMDKRFKLMR